MVNISELTPEQLRELAFTEAERKELEKARAMPVTFDADCPPVTPERAKRFRRAKEARETRAAQ